MTNFFNNFFWLTYCHSYFIDLTCFLFVYVPTCLAVYLPTYLIIYAPTHPLTYLSIYLFTYPPTHSPTYAPIYLLTHHLLTYLLIIYTMLMSINVWYTKYEGIVLSELTTISILFAPLTSTNDNPECGYCTFDQLLWPT